MVVNARSSGKEGDNKAKITIDAIPVKMDLNESGND